MSQKCKFNCKSIENIDLFAKLPEFYFKGKPRRSTTIGRILTIIYAIIYAAFFIYKVIRMALKIDVSFYETTTFTGEIPSIRLTNEHFYGGFGLVNPLTGNTYIDETIYYPKVEFRMGKKEGNVWDWDNKELEVEQCKIEKFGDKFRDLFKDKIENLYCLKDLDVILEGHTTYDVYSYFYLAFYPCVNGKDGRTNCKSREEIAQYLTMTMVTFKMQDIELTPQLYKTPTQVRSRELSAPVMANLYQSINAYFHIINIETDNDVLGFEVLSQVDAKKYFKYDVTFTVSSTNEKDILLTGDPLCNINIQLTEQMVTIDRTYTKLVDVLGDVGGLMEFIFSFFNILANILTDTLYEKSLVNNLFSFDLDKKVIIIKKNKKSQNKIFNADKKPEIYNPMRPLYKTSQQSSIYMNVDTIRTKSRLNEQDTLNKNKQNNDILLKVGNTNLSKRKARYNSKALSSLNKGKFENNETKLKKNIYRNPKYEEYNVNELDFNYMGYNKNYKETGKGKKKIINKIKLSKLNIYFCLCCARKMKNIENILIDEGMTIISEKLDITNIFIKLYRDEIIQQKFKKDDTLEISDECKRKLSSYYVIQ